MEQCHEHSGHEARLKTLEESVMEVSKSLNTAHRRVDGIHNWVIAGMSAMVIQLIVIVVGLVILKG